MGKFKITPQLSLDSPFDVKARIANSFKSSLPRMKFHLFTCFIALLYLPPVFAIPQPKLSLRDNPTSSTSDWSGPVSLTYFPACANASCVTSGLLSPSRLGCTTPTLTQNCLCNVAVAPLKCAAIGPSDQDNCWFELESWFESVCPTTKMLDPKDMPPCLWNCTIDAIVRQGCPSNSNFGSVTVNCFCELKDQAVINAAQSCMQSVCKSSNQYFNVTSWRDNICLQGSTSDYNATANKNSGVQTVIPVTMAFVAAITVAISV
jgi:hypothetical protein